MKILKDIKGKPLKVGQEIVFCVQVGGTELDTGIIERVDEKSIYIKRGPEVKGHFRFSDYITKKLLEHPSVKLPGYNRLEVCVIKE